MKTLILYKTRDGSTKDYAKWIHDEINDSDIFNIDEFQLDQLDQLDQYDRIVIGSRTYMNKIGVQDFMKDNWDKMKDKRVYLFSVGMVPADSAESKQSYERLADDVKTGLAGYTKLPGRIEVKGLNFFEKLIMKMRGGQEKGKSNQVDKENIQEILDWLK